MFLVSACLIGLSTRYDGGHCRHEALLSILEGSIVIPVCPEQLGGLPTPRYPSEIVGGDGRSVLQGRAFVFNKAEEDMTASFIKGAEQTLSMASFINIDGAVFKSRSPSCGAGLIYDGSFTNKFREGDGVTAALLRQHRIPLYTEENLDALEVKFSN